MKINRKSKVRKINRRKSKRVVDWESFGERLRTARMEGGVTQLSLSESVGVSVACISHYEAGRRAPRVEGMVKISEFLNVSLDHLIFGS